MNLIFLSSVLPHAKTITLSRVQIGVIAAALFLVPFIGGAVVHYYLNAHAERLEPSLRDFFVSGYELQRKTLAMRLGHLEAQVLRINALSKHVGSVAGINLEKYQFNTLPPRGGLDTTALPLTNSELKSELNRVGLALQRSEQDLMGLQSKLFEQVLEKNALPNAFPIAAGWLSSNFGVRIDPFSGVNALHEGVDFPASGGEAILAAASGMVSYSDYHTGYGNVIEIDHGNGFTSRYAHASKLLASAGEIVIRGQKIGEVGSTGRSTGPHLHFEVRRHGIALDPALLLKHSEARKLATTQR